ncbi:unnamed protein product [Discosporangium mesarthrocarpum]
MALAIGKYPLPKDYWAMRQVMEGPLPQLAEGEGCSAELLSFIEAMLRRDPEERLTAAELLEHPFLTIHKCRAWKAPGLGRGQPATPEEVQSLMKKLVKHNFNSWIVEDDAFTREGNSPAEGGRTPSTVLQSPSKQDFTVLARQLRVTTTELVNAYNQVQRDMQCHWAGKPCWARCSGTPSTRSRSTRSRSTPSTYEATTPTLQSRRLSLPSTQTFTSPRSRAYVQPVAATSPSLSALGVTRGALHTAPLTSLRP